MILIISHCHSSFVISVLSQELRLQGRCMPYLKSNHKMNKQILILLLSFLIIRYTGFPIIYLETQLFATPVDLSLLKVFSALVTLYVLFNEVAKFLFLPNGLANEVLG